VSKAAELKELERQRAKITNRIGEIERERDEAESAKFIGRFFKYRNCFSCPEKESDYWWLYFKVTANESRWSKGFDFQRDRDGRVSTDPVALRVLSNNDGWVEITKGEWDAAWSDCLRRLAEDAAA
jgi:hypothetical protein